MRSRSVAATKTTTPQKPSPATQTGAGTFACNVNGRAFIDTSGGYFNCFYQLVDGDYYFGIGGDDENQNPQYIYIQTQKKQINEGETYTYAEIHDGNTYAGGGFSFSPTESYQSYTNPQYTGELSISKLDFVNNIVSAPPTSRWAPALHTPYKVYPAERHRDGELQVLPPSCVGGYVHTGAKVVYVYPVCGCRSTHAMAL